MTNALIQNQTKVDALEKEKEKMGTQIKFLVDLVARTQEELESAKK